jgi:hypothetical protein
MCSCHSLSSGLNYAYTITILCVCVFGVHLKRLKTLTDFHVNLYEDCGTIGGHQNLGRFMKMTSFWDISPLKYTFQECVGLNQRHDAEL